jgi:hypothetical protein
MVYSLFLFPATDFESSPTSFIFKFQSDNLLLISLFIMGIDRGISSAVGTVGVDEPGCLTCEDCCRRCKVILLDATCDE